MLLYVLIGLGFWLWLVRAGLERLSPAAASSGFLFTLMILPGSVALWPYLWRRCRTRRPPREMNRHHFLARLAHHGDEGEP